ncbi:Protein CASP [Camellia lanceoleosa]|uniref:Protein CASP n=1 Tax=Camellia lanceoleosa TaxID=1840588 RepID=A0ACC0FGP1_9ERIC|nr:Protein CASP [Camellia lanceoleosa]
MHLTLVLLFFSEGLRLEVRASLIFQSHYLFSGPQSQLEIRSAMECVFGSTFVCKTIDAAREERDQRYRELGLRDKITLSSGRFLLGNKYARTFVFFYTIGLHILVFTCLYRMSALSYLSNGPEESLIEVKNLNLPH